MNKKILALLVVVGAGVLAYVFWLSREKVGDASSAVLTAEEEQEVSLQKAAILPDTAASRYTHPVLGFSFEKPEGYTIGVIPGNNDEQTLIVQPTSGDVQKAFQIIIMPLDEPLTLSPDVVTSALPGTTVNTPLAITLDGDGKGMMFASNNDAFGGKSYEIWFTTDSHLYQITSYKDFEEQLKSIIGTWKFS